MQSSFRAMSLAFALVGTLVLCVGCSQGEGDRCQIDSDCSSGLVCRGGPTNGICSRTSIPNSGSGGSTGQDAAGPVSTLDAASDDGAGAADATSSVDSQVVADGATVGEDHAPDAEAADSL
jgi:hypothetical protein